MVVLSCLGAESPKPTLPECEQALGRGPRLGPLGGALLLGPAPHCPAPCSLPLPLLCAPPGLSEDRAGRTLGRLQVPLRKLGSAWVCSLGFSCQERRAQASHLGPRSLWCPLPGVDTFLQQ